MLKKWGNEDTIRTIWDEEFVSGQWDYLENTRHDDIYRYIERYANKGSILDLGCGSGNTGNEMDVSTYRSYTGVDISRIAIKRALERTKKNGRMGRNEYIRADTVQYIPREDYDIILFRESLFYIPETRVQHVLDRYSAFLRPDGVFIVRICDGHKHARLIRLIEKHYSVVERFSRGMADIIMVFR